MKKNIFVIMFIFLIYLLSGNEITDFKITKDYNENKIDFYLLDNDKNSDNGFVSFIITNNLFSFQNNLSDIYKNKINDIDIINLGFLYKSFINSRRNIISQSISFPLMTGGGIGLVLYGYFTNFDDLTKMAVYSSGGISFAGGVVSLTLLIINIINTIISYTSYNKLKSSIINRLNNSEVSINKIKIKFVLDIDIKT